MKAQPVMKRFTETTKWADPWYQDLPIKYKSFWTYINDNCDGAGVWTVNTRLAAFQIGEPFEASEILRTFGDKIEDIGEGRWWIKSFIAEQYGILSPDCKPHLSVIRLLSKHELSERVSKGLAKGMLTLEEKEKVQDKEKDRAPARGIPPLAADALEYGCSLGMTTDEVQSWYDHFESNGWKVSGKTPMKDWKAALRTGKKFAFERRAKGSVRVKEKRRQIDPSQIDLPDKFKSWAIETFAERRDEIAEWKTWADVPDKLRKRWWGETKPPFVT